MAAPSDSCLMISLFATAWKRKILSICSSVVSPIAIEVRSRISVWLGVDVSQVRDSVDEHQLDFCMQINVEFKINLFSFF
ncbi:unnamed protein product [Lathyrus oleraceus]